MALAHQLSQLAQANESGMLSDDEYRLLRHSVFQQYSADAEVVPRVHGGLPSPDSAGSPSKPVSHTMSSLIRRATRKPPSPATPKQPRSPKLNIIIPRFIHKLSSPGRPKPRSRDPAPPPSLELDQETNISSTSHIRAAIARTQDEADRLVQAFDHLEATALRRLRSQSQRRLPANTPANVNVLLEGREWREHRLVSPLADSRQRFNLSTFESTDTHSIRSSSSHKTSLSQSRSISSLPKSTILPLTPLSATFSTPRKASVSSVSSSNRTSGITDMLSIHSPSTSTSFSRSTSHLPLRSAFKESNKDQSSPSRERSGSLTGSASSKGTVAFLPLSPVSTGGQPDMADRDPPEASLVSSDAELNDIRRRRKEVIERYAARIEYLKAKLKGAELHEKLLRR